ncbi:hypothetical protein [Halobaculum sp. D14]|uniref:hypothetical protein n=1 Tax=Halobaculum sp. D14 TaxID=3421642 RepID=UPI003EBC0D85
MRELDCDFCGAPAAGAYEVVPEELDPAPAEQVRVVLCADCRATLDTVVGPLLDRLGVDDAADTAAAGDVRTGGGDADANANAAAGQERTPGPDAGGDAGGAGGDDDGPADAERGRKLSPADDAVIIDPAGRVDSEDGAQAAARSGDDGGDAGFDDGGDSLNSLVTEAGGGDADAENGAGDAARGSGDPTAADADSGGADDADDDDSAAGAGAEPPNFRKVMRLLNNREFPVDRAEIVELASGAYELDTRDVDDIIDYAVDRGVLAEENGALTKA